MKLLKTAISRSLWAAARGSLTPLLIGFLALSCASAPPPAPPPAPVPEPEPEPECEAVIEDCKAKRDTRVQVTGSNYVFTPPKGWVFAQLEETGLTQVGDDGAAILTTSYVPDEKKSKRAKQRYELVKNLAEIIFVTPEKKSELKKGDKQEHAGLKVEMWELVESTRNESPGSLLVVAGPIGERELLFVAFAPADVSAGEAIMKALDSLEEVSAKKGDGSDDDNGADEGGR